MKSNRHFVHSRFDSKSIRYFFSAGNMVPRLARAIERTTNFSESNRVKYSKWVQKPAKFALERPRNQIQARYIQTRSDKWI